MSRERHTEQLFFDPAHTGFNATSVDAAANGRWMPCTGYNQLTLEVFYDRAAGTGLEFYLETSPTDPSSATAEASAGFIMAGDLASTGIETLTKRKWLRTVSVDDRFMVNIPINCRWVRIADMLSTGSPVGDTATVYATLGVV